MTDGSLGQPTNDDRPLQKTHIKTKKAQQIMTKETALRRKLIEEVSKFEKTMEELHLLKRVSDDLKSYRRMIRIKQNDWKLYLMPVVSVFWIYGNGDWNQRDYDT